MPWCPKCRQEYLATVTSCADCGTALVADLAAIDAAAVQGQERMVRILAPEKMLPGILTWLERSQVPVVRLEDAEGIGIPVAFADRVATVLEGSADLERNGDEIRVLGPATGQEPQLPSDPEIVRRSLEELAADPGGNIPKVLALFATDAPRSRRWAAEKLRALEQTRVVALGDVAVWLAREGYRKPLFGMAEAFAESPPSGL